MTSLPSISPTFSWKPNYNTVSKIHLMMIYEDVHIYLHCVFFFVIKLYSCKAGHSNSSKDFIQIAFTDLPRSNVDNPVSSFISFTNNWLFHLVKVLPVFILVSLNFSAKIFWSTAWFYDRRRIIWLYWVIANFSLKSRPWFKLFFFFLSCYPYFLILRKKMAITPLLYRDHP